MKKIVKYIGFVLIVLPLFLATNILADYNPFSGVKNARELMKKANQIHFHVNFHYRPARDISHFDKVEDIHVSRRIAYVTWYNTFRMNSYIGKGIDEARRDLKNSNISLKIIYTPTTSTTSYNRIYKQSIQPGRMISAKKTDAKTNTSYAYSRQKQNNLESDRRYGGHYETITVRSFGGAKKKRVWVQSSGSSSRNSYAQPRYPTPYDPNGNVLLTLYVYKYAGKAVKMINLYGLSLEEAKNRIKKAKLPISYIQDVYEKTTNPTMYGKIFFQTIKAGTPIFKPQMMGVKIYRFPPKKMPNLIRQRISNLKKSDYYTVIPTYVETFNRYAFGRPSDGVIFYQSVKPGTLMSMKTKVLVKVYKYKDPFTPSDFIGLGKNEAIQKARNRKINYYIKTIDIYKYYKKTNLSTAFLASHKNKIVAANFVKEHRSVFGTKSPNHIEMTEVVVKCIKPPNVIGKKIDDAIATIKKAGFKPIITEVDVLDYINKHKPVYPLDKVSDEDMSCKTHGSKVEIKRIKPRKMILPNWEGRKYDSIKNDIKKIKTKLGNIRFELNTVNNRSYKKGNRIVSSTPKWGSTIKTFDTVKIYYEKDIYLPDVGPYHAYIPPDIEGKTEKEAKKELLALGFSNVKVKKEKKVGAVEGTVIDVLGQIDNSSIGKVRIKAERLTLLIADKNGVEMPIMPNVLGLTPEKAKEILVKKGFKDIRFKSEASSFVKHNTSLFPIGTVISTSVDIGSKCLYGYDTIIELVVKLKPKQTLPSNTKKTGCKKSETVKVPPLKTTISDAIKAIKDAGLIPKVNYVPTKLAHFKGKTKPGSIPAWGTVVKCGSTVTFSAYVYNPQVPFAKLCSKETAIKLIRKNGLKEKVTYLITDNKNLDGEVKSQKPKPGTKVKPGSFVEILVYKYSNMTIVPKLVNLTKQHAIDIIEKYTKSLKYKVVYVNTALKTLDGKVLKTSPSSGARAKNGTAIVLYVYKLLKKVPSVVGKTEQDATKYLESLGFGVKKLYAKGHKASIVWFQHPEANSNLTHAGITLSIGKSIVPKPSINHNIRMAKPASDAISKIQNFYRRFKEAYESKDESQVVGFLSDDWTSANGGDVSDLENNLNRSFRVFDEIQYKISGLNIQSMGYNKYRVAYNVNIIGQIYDDDITHEEKSSVQEEVIVKHGKVKIIKTLGGRFWSIK